MEWGRKKMKTSKKVKRTIKKGIKQAIGLEKKPIPRNDFSNITKSVIRRFQKGVCEVPNCRERRFLDYDHIRGRDNNSAENCQLLCKNHHALKTKRDRIRRKLARDLDAI